MRQTPAQIAVRLICGTKLLPPREARIPRDASLADRIKIGHDMLVSIAQKDFGYDLHAWHAFLKESRDGGYKWGRNIILPRIMMAALASEAWQGAVRQLAENERRR